MAGEKTRWKLTGGQSLIASMLLAVAVFLSLMAIGAGDITFALAAVLIAVVTVVGGVLLGLWHGTGGFSIFDKNRGDDAEQSDDRGKDPGHFFKDIRGLLYAHELVGKTSQVSGQTATLGILNQHYQA